MDEMTGVSGSGSPVCSHGQLARVCRVCELEQEVADMRGDMLFAARACVGRLNAKDATITALRAALAQVEWVPARGDKNRHICPWCGFPKWMGHMSDCARQAALGVGRWEGE